MRLQKSRPTTAPLGLQIDVYHADPRLTWSALTMKNRSSLLVFIESIFVKCFLAHVEDRCSEPLQIMIYPTNPMPDFITSRASREQS